MTNGLGEFIRARRTQLGLTQDDLGMRMGVTHNPRIRISQIETRTKLPGPETRRKLAEALGVRHIDLLFAAGELCPDEIPAGRAGPPSPLETLINQLSERDRAEVVRYAQRFLALSRRETAASETAGPGHEMS